MQDMQESTGDFVVVPQHDDDQIQQRDLHSFLRRSENNESRSRVVASSPKKSKTAASVSG